MVPTEEDKRIAEIFRSKLRQIITEKGMTQADVAFETGVSKPTISRYLAGARLPDLRCITALCKFLGVSADWMLGLSDETPVGDDERISVLYRRASDDDKAIIDMILKKYK